MSKFRLLGPLQVWDGGDWVGISAAQQRVVLAMLLAQPNHVIAVDQIVDELWADDPPARAVNTVQAYVLRLRRAMDDRAGERLVTHRPGYRLVVGDNDVDAQLFAQGAAAGHKALADGRPQHAADELTSALALWRGGALADVPATPVVTAEVARLEQLRLTAIEARVDAMLELGGHEQVVAELEALVAEHPLRERLRARLMLALYRCGRRADALDVYRVGRDTIVAELGLDPGPELRQLERAILNDEPDLGGRQATPAGTPVPAQLPASTPTFVGRTGHLRALDAMVPGDGGAPGAPVVISAIAGTAGVGKSALAVTWAQRVRPRFPDGQLYADLRAHGEGCPVRPLDVLVHFLVALGVPAEQVPTEEEPAAALYRTLLADRRVLVLLDDAHDACQVRPLLPGGPGCLVVVTARARLGGLVAMEGARELTVDVLTDDEALTLLRGMLGDDRVDRDPQMATELAHLCANLPLALRIAAANLLERPTLPLADHVARLRGGDRLTALQVAGDTQAAVRRAFELSYAGLDDEAARTFRLMGLAPGTDLTPAGVAALTDRHAARTDQALAVLEGAHLIVRRAPGRYAFHDLLRLFARERAEAEDSAEQRAAALARLCDHHLRAADAAARALYPDKLRLPLPELSGPQVTFVGRDDALVWLDAERHNLRAVIEHAAAHGPRPTAWLLADTLRGYFWLRMRTVGWIAVAGAGLTAADAAGDVEGRSAAHLSLGDAFRCQSRYEQAISHYLQAAELARDADWIDGEAAALGNLGNTYWRAGQLDKAAEQHTAALGLDRAGGRLAGQAASLANLACVDRELGRLDDAAAHLSQALAIDEQLGAHSSAAMDLTSLGEIDFALGHLTDARNHLTRALQMHREIGDRDSEAETLRVLGAVHCAAGDLEQARADARAGLELARETGNHRTQADTLNVLGAIADHRADYTDAAEQHRLAIAVASATDERHPWAAGEAGLARAHLRLDHLALAEQHAARALTMAADAGYRLIEGDALRVQAAAHMARGDARRAAYLAGQAAEIHHASGHRLGEARAALVLGAAQEALGDELAAAASRQRARAIVIACGAAVIGPLAGAL